MPEQVSQMIKAKLLIPAGDGTFDQDDISQGRMLARALAAGLTVKDLLFYPRLGQEIVQNEMNLRRKVVSPMPLNQDIQTTTRMLEGARLFRRYVIERLFQELASAADK